MQKSLRWHKNWKCSIKRTHLNVWLVKVNVVLKFFICHTPWGLSYLPCLWKLPHCTLWNEGEHDQPHFCWRAPGCVQICLAPGLRFHYPKTATLKIFPRSAAFYSYSGRNMTKVPCPSGRQTNTRGLPVQCSFHTTRLALRCTRENAPVLPFSYKVLDQNLEKPLVVRYHFGPSTSEIFVGIPFTL